MNVNQENGNIIMSEEEKYPRGIEVISGPFIINDKNQLLLCLSPKWGVWIVPGGHVNPGETTRDACIRETKEELGLDIEIVDFLSVAESFAEPPIFKRHAHFIFFNYIARLKSSHMDFNEEISETRWFDLDDVLKNPEVKISCKEGAALLKKWLAEHQK